jgi:hypothetical protein
MDLLELEEDEDMVASYANFYLPNGGHYTALWGSSRRRALRQNI